ncbi:Protein-glutamate methylesterase/protein-glutamine glutaminase [Paraburkholderia hiiakae]|uniref:Protein-glutamate methylesterase/protein-glutamine glutaminase n=1 Tax=Paraburkholderia hiiakae TaxID=1081782 RepID=A0ABM8NE73_9BURK|nr:response regulator [Paraburkholderia hiiakae]CAD6519781.1 Protein-glutamate methylesterase/protein-glutamine glutaminase [Paraburkholderia hiiakae]
MARMVVASVEPLTRMALSQWLVDAGHEVVGEAEDGYKAYQLARGVAADVMLLDLDLPRLSGLEVLKRIRTRKLPVKVIILGASAAEALVQRCMDADADALVPRNQDPAVLHRAIADALAGQRYFPLPDSATLAAPASKSPFALLSDRELTILKYLARGIPNNAIARELSISEKTVSAHRSHLRRKLHARSLVDLLEIARQHGLMESVAPASVKPSPEIDLSAADIDAMHGMLDGAPLPLHIRDLEGRLIACNAAFLELHGTTFEAVVGKRMTDVDWFPPHIAQSLHARYMNRLASGSAMQADVEITRHGQRVILHTWAHPFRNAQGELLGVACGSVDVTGRSDMARALWLQREEAESASRRKSALFLEICAQMRPAVGVLSDMLAELRDRGSPPTSNERIGAAAEVIHRLSGLIDGIEDMMRLEEGELSLSPRSTNVGALIDDTVTSLTEYASHLGVALRSRTDLPEEDMMVDPVHVGRLLRALLRQCVVGHPGGEVAMSAMTVTRSDGQRDIAVQFDAKHGDKRVDPLAAPAIELNLSLCRAAVELLKGSMQHRAPSALSTSITLRIPVHK